MRSRAGLKAVSLSLGVLGAATLVQAGTLVLTGSVALLADLIHNLGDALTAVPVGIAFLLRSFRAEKNAGLAVVLAIFVSACVALYESIERLIHPQELSHLWVLAAAGLVGFVGNELAAQVRLRAGKRLSSPALSPTATTPASTASSASVSSQAPSWSPSARPLPTRSSASSSRS